MNILTISHKNTKYAYIVRNITSGNGEKHFFSDDEDYLQVGTIQLLKDDIIQPHYHLGRADKITKTQEVIIVISGVLQVNIFSLDKHEKIEIVKIKEGDILVLLDGGHSFKALSDVQILEIKQGPYRGVEIDKKRF